MSPEQMLLTALGIVTSWMLVCVKILWNRSEQCERDRLALREEIEEVRAALGMAHGELKAVTKCPIGGCPFKAASVAAILALIGILMAGCASTTERSVRVERDRDGGWAASYSWSRPIGWRASGFKK